MYGFRSRTIQLYHPQKNKSTLTVKTLPKTLPVPYSLRILLKTPESGEEEKELNEKIFQWFRIPNPAFPDAMSPFELVADGKGEIVIRSLLDQLHGNVS